MTLETGIAIAILNEETFWYVNTEFASANRTSPKSNKVGIPLPTPQRSGTEYQKETYARMKAREIIEKHNLNKYY